MPRLKRYDTKKLLENPDLRRRLIVDATVATQAREGIEVSRDEAENSYYVVSEGERAAFFGLVPFRTETGENDGRHVELVNCINNPAVSTRIDLARDDFRAIDSSPIAYDKLGLVAHLFRENPGFDSCASSIEQGVALMNVARYVRHFWEIDQNAIAIEAAERSPSKPWARLSKGGDYSRFYYDFDLVIYCQSDWEDMKIEINQRYPYLKGKSNMLIHEDNHYFEAGLTWPRRTQRGFNIRYLPKGHIFSDKGPTIFLKKKYSAFSILGILNSNLTEYLLKALVSFGSWEIIGIRRLPIPQEKNESSHLIELLAKRIFDFKESWDTGNETCTRFDRPWVLQPDVNGDAATLCAALDAVLDHEAALDVELQATYAELNDAVYHLYGVNAKLKAKLEAAIGQRPPEIVWPQMEGKDREQKRREHVDRLLLHLVRRVVEADTDGLVCLEAVAHEPPLLDRLRHELYAAFPAQDPAALETEVINELKKKTKGYRRAESLAEWLQDVFFETHCRLYQQRPLIWHLASDQTRRVPAFGALVHAHKFDADALAKLRGTHLRDRLAILRREAGQAAKDGREEDRLEALAAVEEAEAYDEKLKRLQEGYHSGPFAITELDYRILTPWKTPAERPKGWHPDLDDGIKVNIDPLGRTGLLRIRWRSAAVEED